MHGETHSGTYTMLERAQAIAKARNVSLNCVTDLLPGEIAASVKSRLHVWIFIDTVQNKTAKNFSLSFFPPNK